MALESSLTRAAGCTYPRFGHPCYIRGFVFHILGASKNLNFSLNILVRSLFSLLLDMASIPCGKSCVFLYNIQSTALISPEGQQRFLHCRWTGIEERPCVLRRVFCFASIQADEIPWKIKNLAIPNSIRSEAWILLSSKELNLGNLFRWITDSAGFL